MIGKFVKLLLAVCVVLSLSSGVEMAGTYRLCGRNLVDALSVLCNGNYYDPSDDAQDKRSSKPGLLDPYPGWFAVALSGRGGNGKQLYKRDRGIVDECCRDSCTMTTLSSYCR